MEWYRRYNLIVLSSQYFKKINFSKSRSEILDKLEGRWAPKKKFKRNPVATIPVKESQLDSEKDQINEAVSHQQVTLEIPVTKINPPNNVLMLEDLPTFVTTEILQALFGQYPGFK